MRFSLFIFVFLVSSYPIQISAKEIKYNHNSTTIPEIKKKVDFSILSPKNIPSDWTLDTKISPWIMLHYMDSKDEKLMVAIHLRRGGFSLQDKDYPNSQRVVINGKMGYFSSWENCGELDNAGEVITGGLLCWTQDGTYIEMDSSRLSKKVMLEIARSME